MIFKSDADNFHLLESYKERNLYYKILGGYYFNELIGDYENRVKGFIEIISNPDIEENRIFRTTDLYSVFEALRNEEFKVTFDYHIAQVRGICDIMDRGEMSDVLITTKSSMVSIECKFLSNFNVEKDIFSVQERIQKFSHRFQLKALQVILIKEEKWKNSGKIIEKISIKFSGREVKIPFVVIFWEELDKYISDKRVKSFLEKQLQRIKQFKNTTLNTQ